MFSSKKNVWLSRWPTGLECSCRYCNAVYVMVCWRYSARPSKLRAKISIACIWLVAGILAAPMAVALRVALVEEVDSSKYTTRSSNLYSIGFFILSSLWFSSLWSVIDAVSRLIRYIDAPSGINASSPQVNEPRWLNTHVFTFTRGTPKKIKRKG